MNNPPNPFNMPNPGTAKPPNTHTTNTKRPAPELLEQAAFLFLSGWHYVQADTGNDLFFIHNRAEDLCFIVFIDSGDDGLSYCTCPTFGAEGDCVHLLAIQHELVWLAQIEAQEREIEERERYSEHLLFGTEPEPGSEW